jgi:DNA-binding NtrC family response regulator
MTDVPSPTKVLVIDDEEDIRDACKAVLEKDGLCVFTASDGKGGIEIFGRELPAVVLVDLKIPGMSGLEVVDHIRGVDETVVNVVITGYGTVENAVEAMKKGVYEFLSKPFTPDHSCE